MSEINATYGAFLAVSDREGEFNEDGEDIYEAACDRWLEAKGALRDYAVELAAKPTKYDIESVCSDEDR